MTLDTRQTELIALGAAVAANCSRCLEFHMGKAREVGLEPEEIAAALEVGRMVRRGAGGAIDQLAAQIGVGSAEAPTAASRGCGCQ